MNAFNPSTLGWPEFWLRIAVTIVAVTAVVLVVMVVMRLCLDLCKAVRWVAYGGWRRVDCGDATEGSAFPALKARQAEAEKLLRSLLEGPLYLSEYDGRPPRLLVSPEAAQRLCEEDLGSEPEAVRSAQYAWDWMPDEDGWRMWRTNRETDRPVCPERGRVTVVHIEK